MKRFVIWVFVLSQIIFCMVYPFLQPLIVYLHSIVIVVTWVCWTTFFLFIALWMRSASIYIPKSFLLSLFACYSIGLIVLLFFRPSSTGGLTINLIPFQTIQFYLSGRVSFLIAFYNLAANIGLFIPVGLWWKASYPSRSKRMNFLFPLVLIISIESVQLLSHSGAWDIDDFILNILGVYIGYMLTPLCQKVIHTH
ncbi:VanZ family protein [Radiobacillus deserti]|uniref:VanZ family protein n=1 Tax=Radiobacillus deserti TaxID=2594883 RepID=A0A516KEK7_9BACI|nr:VanZ family protein [Radiobacillus deserti]QDP39746.1 VanZ family protein [Radiobacillus deserti]